MQIVSEIWLLKVLKSRIYIKIGPICINVSGEQNHMYLFSCFLNSEGKYSCVTSESVHMLVFFFTMPCILEG